MEGVPTAGRPPRPIVGVVSVDGTEPFAQTFADRAQLRSAITEAREPTRSVVHLSPGRPRPTQGRPPEPRKEVLDQVIATPHILRRSDLDLAPLRLQDEVAGGVVARSGDGTPRERPRPGPRSSRFSSRAPPLHRHRLPPARFEEPVRVAFQVPAGSRRPRPRAAPLEAVTAARTPGSEAAP